MPTEAGFLELKSRLSELEDRMPFLYRRFNIDYLDPNAEPALAPQIQRAVWSGNKIEASHQDLLRTDWRWACQNQTGNPPH